MRFFVIGGEGRRPKRLHWRTPYREMVWKIIIANSNEIIDEFVFNGPGSSQKGKEVIKTSLEAFNAIEGSKRHSG